MILGKSVEGRSIEVFVHKGEGTTPRTVLVLGGFHGDEPKGVYLARRLIELLKSSATVSRKVRWVVVPVVNPDGYAARKRRNANRVDVNRNFPTKNWALTSKRSRMFGGIEPASEPETKAVILALRRYRPSGIVTIHSIGENRFCNNFDGPGAKMAKAMEAVNGYPATGSIGYETPGSFGAWVGIEQGIATVTLELPSHDSSKRCWEDNRMAILACASHLRRVRCRRGSKERS